MFDRFSDNAKRAMNLARQEAQRLRHGYLDAEHMLLGLVALARSQRSSCSAARILEALGLGLDRVRAEVERSAEPEPGEAGQLPFTAGAKRALEGSLDEAGNLGHRVLGTEHLLLGLLRESDGVAARVLLGLGVLPAAVRALVIEMDGAATESEGPRVSPDVHFSAIARHLRHLTREQRQAIRERLEDLDREERGS